LDIPPVRFQPGGGTVLTQERRLELLRRFLAPGQRPAPATAAACLLLLYAQPLTRIHRLTTSDILDNDGQMHIRFGDPLIPVPEPLADILRQLPRDGESPWLFPGLLPGQPIGYSTLREQVSVLGLPLREARISALRQLVLDAPAPVIAGALGFHQTTTTRQVAHAGGTWNRYRASAPPTSGTP
jgi:integrase